MEDGCIPMEANMVMADWILDGMADVCSEARGRLMDWGTYGPWQD